MAQAVVGIIGGSGVYELPGLENIRERIATPWGEPSDDCVSARSAGRRRSFCRATDAATALALHDQLPRQYRRDEARRRHRHHLGLGLRLVQIRVFSGVSSCSSINSSTAPSRAHPPSSATAASRMSRWRIRSRRNCCRAVSPAAAQDEGIEIASAEPMSAWRGRSFRPTPNCSPTRPPGYDVIGMTAMPEAKLAREAEISYATVAMVTDFDCWHPEHDNVDVASVIEIVRKNSRRGRAARSARAAQGFPRRARALPHRLRPRARQCDPHRAERARSGVAEEARRGDVAAFSRVRIRSRQGRFRTSWPPSLGEAAEGSDSTRGRAIPLRLMARSLDEPLSWKRPS